MGIEPMISTLARLRITTLLRPHIPIIHRRKRRDSNPCDYYANRLSRTAVSASHAPFRDHKSFEILYCSCFNLSTVASPM